MRAVGQRDVGLLSLFGVDFEQVSLAGRYLRVVVPSDETRYGDAGRCGPRKQAPEEPAARCRSFGGAAVDRFADTRVDAGFGLAVHRTVGCGPFAPVILGQFGIGFRLVPQPLRQCAFFLGGGGAVEKPFQQVYRIVIHIMQSCSR